MAAGLLAAAGGACGSDGNDGPQKSGEPTTARAVSPKAEKRLIAAAYIESFEAISDKRWQDVCDAYSRAQREVYAQPPARSCAEAMRLQYSAVGRVQRPRIVRVRLTGPQRGILYVKAFEDGNTTPLALVKEDGRWRLDGLDDSATKYGTSNDLKF